MTVEEAQMALRVPIIPLDEESGFDLVDAIFGLPVEHVGRALPPEEEYYHYNP